MPQISLKAARVNANLTQSQAAQRLGISEKTLWNWECNKGIGRISWKMLQKIETVYGISRDFLYLPINSD